MDNGKEAAFAALIDNGTHLIGNKGLTKREYFAGLAMQGYISAGSTGMPSPEIIAVMAVDAADKLLEELEK